MTRLQWLDGLKGIAAFTVAFNHFFKGEINAPFRSFWDEPKEENQLVIQLPPIRLLWAAQAMVPLFMVLSGYSISLNLLSLRDTGSADQFFRHLQSSVINRLIRIYLPVTILATVSQLVFFFGLYNWFFPGYVSKGLEPWTAPWRHVAYLAGYLADNMNIATFQWNKGFNGQIWTIPLELRGSYAVYLTVLGLSSRRASFRTWSLAFTLVYLLWYGIWDLFACICGLLLAELQSPTITKVRLKDNFKKTSLHAYIQHFILLVAGIYLMCIPDDSDLPPEYSILAPFRSPHWTDAKFCWRAIGAFMVVSAIITTPTLQRLLSNLPLVYLGQNSFSIYLIHEIVYRIFRNPLRGYIWTTMTNELYPGTDQALKRPVPCFAAWFGSGLALGVVVIKGAEICTPLIDRSCAMFVGYLEARSMVPASLDK